MAFVLAWPSFRIAAQRFFCAAAIAARPAAEMPLRLPDAFGRPGPGLGESFFCLRSAQYCLHPDADRTPFGGGHLFSPAPGAVLRRHMTVIPVAQIRKRPES